MRFVLTLSLILLSFFSSGQSLFMQGVDTPWTSGELILNDGSQYKGVVKYNELIGSISYKSDTLAKESRTFSEQDIYALTVLDSANGKIRRFYSFPYEDNQQQEFILLFEVIKEFENWAVLSRKTGIRVLRAKGEQNVDYLSGASHTTTTAKIAQTEYFYIINEDGSIEFFLPAKIKKAMGYLDLRKTKVKCLKKTC